MRVIFIAFVAMLLAVAAEAGTPRVQARLIRASNDNTRHDAALHDIAAKLKAQLGYTHYRQLGAGQREIKSNDKLLFDLGNGFLANIRPLSTDKKGRELEIEWYSGKTLIVRSTVKILHNGHLFINGPQVADTHIVLAVSVYN